MNYQRDRIIPLSSQELSELKITDMRFCDIDTMPKRCTLIKVYTNAGIVGYGEVRDAATKTYAAMLKSRLLGENPLNVDKLFRRVKQFGHHSRQAGGVSVIHPDVLTAGGMLETKKIGDLAYEYGVMTALHMAESPIGAMAAVHVAAALPQVIAMEFHSADVPYWQDIVNGLPKPLIKDGFITVPDAPGLGIESLNEEFISTLICKNIPGQWEETSQWDGDICNDRLWS